MTETNAAARDPQSAGSAKSFERFLPEARALPAASVRPYRGWESHARVNVRTAAAKVVERKATIVQELPKLRVEDLESLPDLADALVFGVVRVERHPSFSVMHPAEREALEARGWELRRKGLAAARSLAEHGILKIHQVDDIEKGRGKLDMAKDCEQLHALFKGCWDAAKGKHPLSAQDVEDMAAVGQQLQHVLKPKGAAAEKQLPADIADAVDARDRLWTLLVQRYELLWRVAAYLFGRDEVDGVVPPLLSRVAAPRTTPSST